MDATDVKDVSVADQLSEEYSVGAMKALFGGHGLLQLRSVYFVSFILRRLGRK